MPEGHPIFAVFYRWCGALGDRGESAARRRRLLADAAGVVVEIGAGTGLNFPHYPAGLEVAATEPDPHMLKAARKAASRARAKVTVLRAAAEALPLPSRSADVVVSTLVLCSVPDQAAALAEAYRVLKPGGRLLLLEHVRAGDPALARKRDRRERTQVRFAGGCHPNRDTLRAVVAAGFDARAVEDVTLPGMRITRPGIAGVARKAEQTG
ncbi:MAG TPA: class I SAM-dependent methyltransferase [Actinomycetota bacterium]|nr:class I SAM-dependent methyltransferase [Actinomycetota bacterium]